MLRKTSLKKKTNEPRTQTACAITRGRKGMPLFDLDVWAACARYLYVIPLACVGEEYKKNKKKTKQGLGDDVCVEKEFSLETALKEA